MKKKYSLVLIAFLCFVASGYGQTEIFNLSGGGTFPAGWTDTNNITAYDIDRSSYYLLECGNPGDIIETPSYDLSSYTSATFEVDIASFGSGTHRALLVEVSTNGGTSFTQSYSTAVTTSSYISRTVNIPTVSANTVLRFSADATSGRGIRLQDMILNALGGSSCNLSTSGLVNTSCDDNGTAIDATDDFITFDLNPTGSNLGTTYSVTVSSGTITPNTGISYGSATTFNLQNGSAGAGNVTITIEDVDDNTCTLDQLISDPGSCGSCSELFISEYHEAASGNEKYIEIYNPTTSTINLSNYRLAHYNGASVTPTYVLALSGSIPSYGTFIVANNSGTLCPATADLCTTNQVMTFTGNDAIALQTSSGSDIDVVGTIGTTANFAANVVLRRNGTVQGPSTTYIVSQWTSSAANDTSNLGTHISDCETPLPELQLVDSTNQNCGYTIDFGNVADGSTSDLTFDIHNIGSVDLNISSFGITGDYSIVSPAAPFVISGGNSQTVTVRFSPLSDGTLTGVLTINNDDADEGTCTVNLTGVGFTPGPNINVRGVTGSNPTIANGSTMPFGFNNTLFAPRVINSTQQTKTFRIGNEGGTAGLNVTGITLTGDTADFFVTSSFTNPFAVDTFQDFTITFQPTTLSGVRSVTVSIANSDSTKNPYTFVVQGTANCPAVSGSISPTEGPAGTIVTILSPGNNLTGATAELNGVALTTISSSNLELIVRLPNTITTGGPLSVQLTNSCIFSNTFNLLNNTIAGCEASTSATVGNLFISEITDSPSGSLTYIELYNATGATINFGSTNYSIRIYNNGNTSSPKELVLNSGTVANNSTFVISTGVAGNQCSVTGGDGSLAQANLALPGASINFFKNSSGVDNPNIGHDYIGLYSPASITPMNPSGVIDSWGVFGDQTWATGLGLGLKGANFQRDTSAPMIPNTTFSVVDWVITDWNDADCGDVDYSTIGAYDFSTGISPSVTLQPLDPVFACVFSASLTIAGIEGYNGSTPSDSQELAYQWYYNAPGTASWTEIVPANTNYIGQLSATLNIIDTFNLDGYQYYCQLREDNSTCFEASNAFVLNVLKSVWDGTTSTWSALPTIGRYAIIDGNYNTSAGGAQTSFSACGLVVNSSYGLDIQNGTYIEIENDIIANGDITVFPQGSVVQNNDMASVSGSGTMTVQKETQVLSTPYDYTYWSSPVVGETVENVFSTVPVGRRFVFNAANFVDLLIETGNTGAFTSGQDDIDDGGDDWQPASGPMSPGVGYAATPSTGGPPLPVAQQFPFVGPFNNGVITPSIVNNSGGAYNDWNFIGNPYPSAISTATFFSVNTGITDAIYLWDQTTPYDADASGNEGYNFSGGDYATISASGVNVPGAGGIMPNNYVSSAQGFFIEAQSGGSITFNNSMRVTGSNDQFFRDANTNSSNRQILWLKLSSDNGVANYLAMAHIEGATDGNDGSFYDVKRNASTQKFAKIYSVIDGSDTEYVIQGKSPSSLDLDEVIEFGFNTFIESETIYTISIFQYEGAFYSDNAIYLRDNLLNIVHNLKDSDYNFTSETGVFNSRFEIIFTPTALSIDDNLIVSNELTIIEFANGDVQIKVNANLTITNVEILDITGRRIYNLQGNNSTEVYDLSRLSKAAYVAKVKLSNGQVIRKKAIKQH